MNGSQFAFLQAEWPAVSKARIINTLGNQAVHSQRPIQQADSVTAIRGLFHVCYWLVGTYATVLAAWPRTPAPLLRS